MARLPKQRNYLAAMSSIIALGTSPRVMLAKTNLQDPHTLLSLLY